MAEVSNKFLMRFVPEMWTPTTRFRSFLGRPFEVNWDLISAVSSVDGHRHKTQILGTLLGGLRQGLIDDSEELKETGHTPAIRSKQYTAVAETIILELYACLDGLRKTIYTTHPRVQGVQNRSTEALFIRAATDTYGPGFPPAIRVILSEAHQKWFTDLRRLRVELTHGDIGDCFLDDTTQLVTYMHTGLGDRSRALVIHDFEGKLNDLSANVFGVVDGCFDVLCSMLEPNERRLPCGMYMGRIYERVVSCEPDLSSQSGKCYSKNWFETEPGYECPIRDQCEAFCR